MSDTTDDLDHIPTIKPAQDEVTSYRRSQERRPDAPQQSSFNGTLVFVIVVLAVMMGLGGFTLYEVQQKLDQTTLLLARSKAQITELEQRLATTDQDFAKSGNVVDKRLSDSEFEIRKLWDVANKRNRDWIKANEAAITKLDGQLDGIVKRMGTVAKSVDDVNANLGKVTRQVGDLRADSAEAATQFSLLRGQVQDQTDQTNAMKRSVLVVENRLKVVDEAIAAIDQHRKQLNGEIEDLRRQLQSLQGGSTTAP